MGKRLDAFFEELASGKSGGAASAAPAYGPKTTAFLESLAENASAGQFPKNAFADTLPQGVAGPVRNDRIMPAYRQSQSREENYGPAGGNIDTSKDYLPLGGDEWSTPEQYKVGVNDRKYTILDEGGKSIIIPMVDAGRMSPQLTDREAVELYHKTGKNYGAFESRDAANAYLDVLKAKDRARRYDEGVIDRHSKEFFEEYDKRDLEEKERAWRESFGNADNNFLQGVALAEASGFNTTVTGLANVNPMLRNNRNFQNQSKAINNVSAEERQQIGEKSAALGVGYDLVQNFAINLPAMAAGTATGLPIVGSAVIFASSFGNDLKYAEEGGHDPGRAYAYALLDGLNQAALDYVGSIPGISKIGDTLTKNIKNPVLKFLGNMGEEALTEDMQSVVENGLKNIILGEEADASPFSEEAMYSALLGALSAGILNGPQAVLEAKRTVSVGNSFIKNGNIGDAIKLGLSNVKSSEEYQTAAKMVTEMTEGKTPSAYQLGALVIQSLSDTATTARTIDWAVRESARDTGVSDDVTETVAAVAVRFSKRVCFVPSNDAILQADNGAGSGAAAVGAYDSASDTIFLNAGVSSESATEFVLKHELTHGIEKTSMWKSLRRVARQQMGDAAFDAEVSRIQSRRSAVGEALDTAGAEKEVVANFVGNNLFTENFAEAITKQDTKLSSVFAGTFLRLRYAMDAIKNGKQAAHMRYAERLFTAALDKTPGTVHLGADGDADTEGETQYSINPNFAEEYRAWDKKETGGYFLLGTTSEALQSVGIDPKKIYWDKSKIKKILENPDHHMEHAIPKVPELLEHPIIIMQSQTVLNRVVLLGEINDDLGHPVLCALELTPNGQINKFLKVASAYGKDSRGGIQSLIDNSDILYVDPNKERTDSWLEARRLQLPVGLTNYGSIGRVTLFERDVKGNFVVSQGAPTKSAMELAFEKAQARSAQSQYMQNSENDASSSTQHAFAGDADTEGEVQYSLKQGAEQEVDRVLNGENVYNDIQLTESSPAIIVEQKGAKNLPLVMKATHIRENIFTEEEARQKGLKTGKDVHYHGLGEDLFLRVIDGLNDVTVAYRGTKNAAMPNRRENYFLLVSQIKDSSGNVINVPVYINQVGRHNDVYMDINRIATVYGNEDFYKSVQEQVRQGNLVRIKRRGIKASEVLEDIPSNYSNDTSSDTTVSQSMGDVNSQYMQNSENDARGSTQHAFAEDADGGIAVEEKVQPDADAYKAHRTAQDMERAEKHRDAVKEREERLANEKQTPEEASPVEEVTQMVEERKAEKRTKFQKKQEAAREDLRRRWQNGALTDEAYDAELAKLTDEAVAENDRKWKSGNRGDAAMRQALGEEYKYTREKHIQKEVEQERQERREKTAAAEEKKAKTALQNKVVKLMDEAKERLAHPQKNRHIPLQHTQTIIDLLQAITVAEEEKQRYIAATREKLGDAVYPATKTRFENQIKKAMDSGEALSRQLDRMAMMYKELQKSDTMKCAYAPELDAVISDFAESIRGRTLSEMTMEELNAAADIVQSVMYAEDNARVIPAGIFGDAVAVDDIVPDMIAEIRQNNVKVPRAVKNFQMYFSDPIVMFNMLGGWHKNSLWSKFGDNIVRESTYREMAVVAKFNELFRDVAQDKRFQNLMEYSPKNMVDSIGLVDEAGNRVSISRGAMLALYAHLGCSSNLEEIMTGGLQMPDLKAYYKGNNNQAYVDGKKIGVSGSNAAQIASLRLDLRDAVTRTNELRERFYALREEMRTDMRADADGAAEIAAKIDGEELKGRKAAIRDAYYELQEAETTESKLQQQYDAALRGERQKWLAVRDAIEAEMTKTEKAYMEKVSEWFNEHQKGFINEPYLNLYGIPRATVKNYFPRHRMMDLVHHDVEAIRMDRSLENLGMLKERVKDSPVPILLTDITYEMREALDATAQFYGYAEATKTLQKVLGYIAPKGSDSTQLAFDEVFGKAKVSTGVSMKEYFDNLLADMNGARQGSNSTVDKALNFIRNNTVRAAIAANFRVFASQFSAVFQIPSVIGWESFQKGTARAVHTKAPVELMRKYSAFWASRSANNIAGMEEIADARSGNMRIDKLYRKIDDATGGWLLNLSGKADAIATGGVVWFSCEEAVKAAHPELEVGSEEYYKAVGKLQDQVIYETQPDNHLMNRSELQRQTGSLIKLVTLFKAQPLKILNQLVTSYNEMRVYSKDLQEGKNGVTKEDVKAKKEKFARVASYSVVMSTVAYVALRAAVNALLHNMNGYRDDDGELNAGSIANAMGLEAISQIADLVPFGGQVYEVVAARVLGERYYGLDDNALEAVGNIMSDIASGNFKSAATYNKLIGDLSSALGIPYKNISSAVKGILYHAEDTKNGEFLSFRAGSGVGMTQTYRQLYKAMSSGKTEKAQALREYLLASGKTAAEIESGIRSAIRSESADAKKQAERAIEEAMTNMYFDSFTEKEQNRVESSIRNFYADKVFSKAGGDMSAANEKAEKAVEKGVTAADYFVAQVLKNARFADKNGDGKVNKAEYGALVDDMACTERVKQILKNMK